MVKHLTLDLGSGPNVRVVIFMISSPMLGSALGMKPTKKKKKKKKKKRRAKEADKPESLYAFLTKNMVM